MKTIAETKAPHTTERVAGVAHTAVDTAAAKAAELEKQLRASMDSAGERLSDTKETATDQIHQAIKKAEKFANEKPLAATGIAFAAGLLAASFLRRK